jgi:hypothetical protein
MTTTTNSPGRGAMTTGFRGLRSAGSSFAWFVNSLSFVNSITPPKARRYLQYQVCRRLSGGPGDPGSDFRCQI